MIFVKKLEHIRAEIAKKYTVVVLALKRDVESLIKNLAEIQKKHRIKNNFSNETDKRLIQLAFTIQQCQINTGAINALEEAWDSRPNEEAQEALIENIMEILDNEYLERQAQCHVISSEQFEDVLETAIDTLNELGYGTTSSQYN